MAVSIYDDPKIFWKEVSPFLKKEESKNTLFLGLAHFFQTHPENCLYQSAVQGSDGSVAALLVSKYRTNINFVPTPFEDPKQALMLFDSFKDSGISINGIIGETSVAKCYQDLFERAGQDFKGLMTQGIYRCREVIMPKVPKGVVFRKAELSDLETISKWAEEFHQEAVPHDPPISGIEFAKIKIDGDQIYVLENAGRLVSMAAWSRDIESSCSVNFVYTPKNLRKLGYASIVTAKLSQHFLEKGRSETNLYTDMTNPTSNKIYQNIGYEFVCNSVHLGAVE